MNPSLAPVVRTSLPLIFAQLAFAVNTFVTQFFLARHSTIALHASLPGSMLAVTLSAFFINTLGYAGTMIAQRHGSGDEAAADAIFSGAVLLTFISIPLFALTAPLGLALLGIFDTNPAVFAAEAAYFKVLLVNGYFTAFAAVLGGYFTGRARTKLVGATTVFGFLLNMALAPIFINGLCHIPTEGVIGAGWSATIAHIVPCLILAGFILREKPLTAFRRLDQRGILELLRLGLPNGLRTVLEIGGFFCFTAFIAECAPAAVAASTAVFAVNNIPYCIIQGLSSAIEVLVGRACGQRNNAEVRNISRAATYLTATVAVLYVLILWFGQNAILDHFLKDPNVSLDAFYQTARLLIYIVAAKALFEMMPLVLQSVLRGLGETAAVCRVQAIASFLVWIPAYGLVRLLHPTVPAYWLTMILSSLASCALLGHVLGKKVRRV